MGDARHARLPAFSKTALAASVLLAALAPGGARAQFFHLDGILECIDHPESPACRERVRPDADAPAPGPAGAPPRPTARPAAAHDAVPKQPALASEGSGERPKPNAAPAEAKPAAQERPSRPALRPPPASQAAAASTGATARRPAGTQAGLKRAIAHVQAGRATRGDMALIEAKAAADDPAAVEVLAWCSLYGRGIPADRVAAYGLYGRAVSLGVPRARENQRIIFERLLTNGERQRVLETANAASGPPRTGTAAVVRAPTERPASP